MNVYVHLYEEEKYYKVTFSVKDAHLAGPNNEEPLAPLVEGTTRAEDIISVLVIERNPYDGKVIMTQYCQMNLQMQVPHMIVNSFLPKAT